MNDQTPTIRIDSENPLIDSKTGWDVRMAHRMVKSILMAHEANPQSWALITAASKPGVPFLNIGGTNACSFYQLTVDREEASAIDAGFVASHDLGRTFTSPENSGLMVLKFEPREIPDVLPRFEAAHESALTRMVPYSSPRKSEHSEQMTCELGRIVNSQLPTPAYWRSSGSPDSSENGAEPAERRPDLSKWPRAVLEWFADSIQRAHSLSPHSWVFRTNGDELSLYVNRPKILAASPNKAHILVSGQVDTSDGLIQSEQLSAGRSFDVPSTWIANVDPVIIPQVRQGVRQAHEEIIDILAPRTAIRPTTAGRHSQELVESLGKELGIALPAPTYLADMPSGRAPKPTNQPLSKLSSLHTHFQSGGFTYTSAQLATFYTALQTKGFVVLSGISGTGKSKIAQGFVDLLPHPTRESAPLTIDRESLIELSVKPYTRKYKRVVIPVDQLGTLPPMNPGEQIVVRLNMAGVSGTGRLVSQQQPGGHSVTYLFFRGAIGEQIREMEIGESLFLVPDTRGDDEGLESISIFTDPSRLPTDVMAPAPKLSRNSLFLSVRPDWRDSTSLLGYYNPLTQTYEWTEFLHFLLRAGDNYEAERQNALAWFIILDEMNLAHVEYYFADLLSIIESGRDDDGWSREPIRLTYPDTLTDNAPPREIHLPPNLYIIGTVNMDETTHAFSPKVLDRAFTIELTDVDFSDYPPVPSANGADLTDDDRQALLEAFTRKGRFAQVSKADVHAAVQAHPEMRDWLQNLNKRLAQHQFHFGYRVFDEIAQFIHNADENGMFDDWTVAFDHAVFMKVLPKFNGSHARLSGPLTSMLEWANDPARKVSVPRGGDPDGTSVVAAPKLERVATRVQRMLDTLEKDGFVSFG